LIIINLTSINIAEKRMHGLIGHFADVSRRICDVGVNQHMQFDVFSAEGSGEALGQYFTGRNIRLHPTLKSVRLSAFEKVIALPFGRDAYKRWRKKQFPAARASFQSDLFNAPLFLPTADVSDLLGLLAQERKYPVLLGFWYSPEIEFEGANRAILKALAKHNTDGIKIGAYDDHTLKDLAQFSHLVEVVRIPCPYDHEITMPKTKTSAKISIGFFGNMRAERGSAIKNEIADLCRHAGYAIIDESVEKQKDATQPVRYTTSLGQSMAACDIVVWPSDADAYAKRTSGIVFHSIANSLPIVVPAQCRPHQILESYAHPHATFATPNPAAILQAISTVASGLELAQKQAHISAQVFHAREGTPALVRFLRHHLLS
jgi:hypothetical protein